MRRSWLDPRLRCLNLRLSCVAVRFPPSFLVALPVAVAVIIAATSNAAVPASPAAPMTLFAQARTGEIGVMVLDAAGRPVAGAEVVASGGGWHSAATDAAGQARMGVDPGTWEVTVLHPDLAVMPTIRSVAVRAGEARAVEFRALARSARIRGVVRFLSDPPTAVTVLSAAAYPGEPGGGTLPVAVAPLAEDRSFSLAVPPGRWRVGLLEVPIGVAARDVVAEQGQEPEVALEADFRNLAGSAGFVFEAGLITERLGPAFSLTTVGLYAIEGNGHHRVLATTQARSDQTYAILAPIPAGTPVGAFAWRPGGAAVPAAARVHATAGATSFADFRFVASSGAVTGTLVDSAGRQVPDGWVAAVSAIRFEEWMMWGRPVHAPGGAFRVRVPLGPVLVRAWRDPRRVGAPVRVSVGGTEPVTVRLEIP